jgi:poly(hydroxyalkanoate) depolymerase family esterase
MRKIFLFIATLCYVTIACAAQYDALKSIQTGGKNRQYYLYVPDNLPANSPLIISCHGMNQDYNYQKTQTQWPLMADTAGFVVVYPVGIAGSVWNMNYETGWDIEGMTDVNFMVDIVSAVKADYGIDDTRVYMSGFSLGGAFTYYVARKAADKFAAFAPISGYDLMNSTTTTSRPVPIIHVHGTADNYMNYSGAKSYVAKWAQAQNCDIMPVETSGSGYNCMHYINGDCGTEVVLYSVTGRGHEPTNNSFHTSDAIWAFCRHYSTACGKIATALDQTNEEMKKCENAKILRDGHFLILRGEKEYTVTGQELR